MCPLFPIVADSRRNTHDFFLIFQAATQKRIFYHKSYKYYAGHIYFLKKYIYKYASADKRFDLSSSIRMKSYRSTQPENDFYYLLTAVFEWIGIEGKWRKMWPICRLWIGIFFYFFCPAVKYAHAEMSAAFRIRMSDVYRIDTRRIQQNSVIDTGLFFFFWLWYRVAFIDIILQRKKSV